MSSEELLFSLHTVHQQKLPNKFVNISEHSLEKLEEQVDRKQEKEATPNPQLFDKKKEKEVVQNLQEELPQQKQNDLPLYSDMQRFLNDWNNRTTKQQPHKMPNKVMAKLLLDKK